MREALADPMLLGAVLGGESWATWRIMLTAAMGEPLTDDEMAVYLQFAGGKAPPTKRIDEALFLVGRRGGKDRATSVLVTYLACFGRLAAGAVPRRAWPGGGDRSRPTAGTGSKGLHCGRVRVVPAAFQDDRQPDDREHRTG